MNRDKVIAIIGEATGIPVRLISGIRGTMPVGSVVVVEGDEDLKLFHYFRNLRRWHYLSMWRSSPFFRYGMRIPGVGIRAKKFFPMGRRSKFTRRRR